MTRDLSQIGLGPVSRELANSGLGGTHRANEGLGPPADANIGLTAPPPSLDDPGPIGLHAHMDQPIRIANSGLTDFALRGLGGPGESGLDAEMGLAYVAPFSQLALRGLGPPVRRIDPIPDPEHGLRVLAPDDPLASIGLGAMPGSHHHVWTTELLPNVEPSTEPMRMTRAFPRDAGWFNSTCRNGEWMPPEDPKCEPRCGCGGGAASPRGSDRGTGRVAIERMMARAMPGRSSRALDIGGQEDLRLPTEPHPAGVSSEPHPLAHSGLGDAFLPRKVAKMRVPAGVGQAPTNSPIAATSVTAGPASQVGTSPLVGHGAKASEAVGVYGTDLGFAATGNGTRYVIFGDTWLGSNTLGVTSYGPRDDVAQPGPQNNDAMGTFVMDLASGVATVELESYFNAQVGTMLYSAVHVETAGGASIPLGDLSTPRGAFGTSKHLYVSVVDPSTSGALLARFAQSADGYSTFHAVGAPLTQKRIVTASIPTGVSDGLAVAIQWQELRDLFTNIAFFSGESPVDAPPLPPQIATPVYAWGRPSFWRSRPYDPLTKTFGTYFGPTRLITDLFLMVLDADALDAAADATAPIPHWYFAGLDADGKAVWDANPGHAVALASEGDELAAVNQMSVTYDAHLGVWLMLYGGRFPLGAAEALEGYDDADAGIMLRWAPSPWGPWSARQRVFNGGAPGGCQVVFDGTSYFRDPTSMPLDQLAKSPTADPSCWELVPDKFPGLPSPSTTSDGYTLSAGFEYGASIWHTAPAVDFGPTRTSIVYFAMSTWNPYHVILMSTTVTREPS